MGINWYLELLLDSHLVQTLEQTYMALPLLMIAMQLYNNHVMRWITPSRRWFLSRQEKFQIQSEKV